MSKITFSFTVSPNRGSSKSKRSNVNHSAKKVSGVVYIDTDANYTVKSLEDNGALKTYIISQSSYPCKGKEVIYRFKENEKGIIQILRSTLNLPKCNYKFKPFAPGVIVEGYLFKNRELNDIIEITKTYYIKDDNKKLYAKYYNLSKEIKRYYYENWITIHNAYEMKYGNVE